MKKVTLRTSLVGAMVLPMAVMIGCFKQAGTTASDTVTREIGFTVEEDSEEPAE